MFLIGEFSKISRVSKRLLHYYDDIGLLKPARIDETTGYRYYSAQQLPQLNRILALKDLGLSLDQIKQMLQSEVSDEEIHGMLMLKKAEVEQTVMEEMQRLRQIETRLQQNTMANESPDVVIKSIAAQPFLSVRTQFSSESETMQFIERLLREVPEKVGRGKLGSLAAVVHIGDGSLDSNDLDIGFFLKNPVYKAIQLTDDHVLTMDELPPVATMATSVQVGAMDPTLMGLGKIAQWIEANGYRISGSFREIGFGISSISDMETAVMEIQMPVDKQFSPSDVEQGLSNQ